MLGLPETCSTGKDGPLVDRHQYGITAFSHGTSSLPRGSRSVATSSRQTAKPSPWAEGHCVPAELDDGVAAEEIQLQLTTSAQTEGRIPRASAVQDCACALWFYNGIALLDKAKHAEVFTAPQN